VKAGPDASICKGESVQLGKGLIEGQAYDWDPDSGLSDPASPHPIASPDTTTLYTLKVSRHGCDTLSDQVEVEVLPLPDAEAGPDVRLPRGQRIRLTASGGVSYLWSPSKGLNNTQVNDPVASPDSSTLYEVLVTDLQGCQATDSVWVRVFRSDRFVPSAFTPDGDGRNDVFRVRGPELEDFRMEVFDRSGKRIFMTERYGDGWDGRIDPEDRKAPQGAYPYIIRGTDENGDPIEMKGMVNLIR
jgi:gliding motility-associated-like protein